MGQRITEKDCQRAMEQCAAAIGKPWERGGNVYAGSPYADPLEPVGRLWTRYGDRNVSFHGAWTLGFAYGGVTVEEISGNHGGVTLPVTSGHVPKRELYEALNAMRRGAEMVADAPIRPVPARRAS